MAVLSPREISTVLVGELARPRTRYDDGRYIAPVFQLAVERRLDKIRTSRFFNLIGPKQCLVIAFQLFQALTLIGPQALSLPRINLGLLHRFQQRLGDAANFGAIDFDSAHSERNSLRFSRTRPTRTNVPERALSSHRVVTSVRSWMS